MPKRTSLLDELITLPWWFSFALAAVVYFGLRFYLPTVEFQSPAVQGIGRASPSMAGIFPGY
jgi:hypothetical protein